jgi:hypothetical protein
VELPLQAPTSVSRGERSKGNMDARDQLAAAGPFRLVRGENSSEWSMNAATNLPLQDPFASPAESVPRGT